MTIRIIPGQIQPVALKPEPALKTPPIVRSFLAIVTLLFAGVVSAHHSVLVNFDTSSSHTVSGTLVKTKWVSPHSQMQVEVTLDDGCKDIWLIEMNAINTIRRPGKKMGFATDDFVIGETITIEGWLWRHHRATYLRSATLQSGQEIIGQSRLDPDLAQIQQD